MTKPAVSPEIPAPAKLDGTEKLAVEMGPLLAFFAGYFLHNRLGPPLDEMLGTELFGTPDGGLYLALALFLPVFAVAFVYSIVKTRRVAPMLLVSGIIAAVMGTLTFVFESKTFIYMKPTIVYAGISFALAGGLLAGKNFLKTMFDGAFEMEDSAWRAFTWRFVAFNLLAAVANEILWRNLTGDCVPGAECPGEAVWVNIKVFGFSAAYFAFVLANTPFLMKHMKDAPKPAETKASDPVDGV